MTDYEILSLVVAIVSIATIRTIKICINVVINSNNVMNDNNNDKRKK